MQPKLLIFQKFNDPALAEQIADILTDNGIDYVVEKTPVVFDPAFRLRNEASDEYVIKMRGEDFDRANEVLAEHEKPLIAEADADHYLFAFTNDELMDVLAKRDEWSAFDVELAKKILADRGITISHTQEHELQEQRIEELKQHTPLPAWLLIIGYISAILGGAIGILIGIHINTAKTTLPNGEVFYNYTEHQRSLGRTMIYIGAGVLIAAVLYRIFATSY